MRALKLCSCAMVATVMSTASWADPADWRFCVATDFSRHTAYLTNLFESPASASAVGDVVSHILREQNLAFQNIQCPFPADRLTSEGKHEVAENFLKALGYRIMALK